MSFDNKSTVNVNVAPYFDDFNSANNYMKVLFKAGLPVQARELNQMQSRTHHQMEAIASNIFKQGSRISGGSVSFNTLSWVRLKDDADLSWFIEGCIAVGTGSGNNDGSEVEAKVIAALPATKNDPPTLFVVYTKTGKDGETTHFIHGEQLTIYSEEDRTIELSQSSKRPVVRCPSCPSTKDKLSSDKDISPTGNRAKQIVVEEGTWYWNGWFIENKKSSLIYSKYGEQITAKIGFDVQENIITHDDDSSLLDNALGYPNNTAPGADRYQIDLTLNIRKNDEQDGDKFIRVAELTYGIPTTIVSQTEYNKIMDAMAQRTYEESGDYTVKPFSLKYIEHKAATILDPDGASVDGNEAYVRAFLSSGLAYVNGYRIDKPTETFFDVPKARTTVKREGSTLFFPESCYVDLVVPEGNCAWPNDPAPNKALITDEQIELKDGEVSANEATGTKIGSMKVWNIKYLGKTKDNEELYRYYVSHFSMNVGKSPEDVKSVTNIASHFVGKPAKGAKFQFMNEGSRNLFYKISEKWIKSLREVDNKDKGSITMNRRIKLNGTLNAAGKYQWDSTDNLFSDAQSTAVVSVKANGVWKTIPVEPQRIIVSSNSITLDLSGLGYTNTDVMMVITGFAVNLQEKMKTLVENETISFQKAQTNEFKANMWLKKGDVLKLRSVTADNGDDLTEYFSLYNGQTPEAYREAYITQAKPVPEGLYQAITVKFDYFSHTDPSGAGFFTVDSYRKVIDSDENDYTYLNLPRVKDVSDNYHNPLDLIDFRPLILNGDVSSSYMPAINTTVVYDAEFYVGRKDLVVIDKDGKTYEVLGIPSEKPDFPVKPPNSMTLFQVEFAPYTAHISDIRVNFIENKRYTMRDIGYLERRIDNLEYYTSLTLAEKSVNDTTVVDDKGLPRYKNGFFVDNFTNYSVARTDSSEFRAIKDEKLKMLRPNTNLHNFKLVLHPTDSKYYLQENGVVSCPYVFEEADKQPYATKSVSINECFIFKRKGVLHLSPNHNTWSDTTREAKQQWNIDTGTEVAEGLAKHINKVQKDFNDFQYANMTTTIPNSNLQSNSVTNRTTTTSSNFGAGGLQSTTTRVTEQTTTTTNITAQESRIGKKTSSYTFDRVTDVKMLPYMKATRVELYATGLLPKTKMYVFFDDKDVTKFVSSKDPDNVAAPFSTDEKGNLSGVLEIPAGMFLNGTKIVKVTNDKTNSGDDDMELCLATAQFYAGGLEVSKQEIEMNITSPTYSSETVTDTRVKTTSRVVSEVTTPIVRPRPNPPRPPSPSPRPIPPTPRRPDPPPAPPPATTVRPRPNPQAGRIASGTWAERSGSDRDPIAQSFTLDQDTMIFGIEVFVAEVAEDEMDNLIFMELRTMVNGYPAGESGVVARTEMKVRELKVTEDARLDQGTMFKFANPVYVRGGQEYCFCVGGWSPKTKLWVAKLGGEAVNFANKIVDTQPVLGSRFRSQNGSTWNAEQYEDLMYVIYRANYLFEDTKKTLLVFDAYRELRDEYEALAPTPFECQAGSDLIKVHTLNGHALNKNDKVRISTIEGREVTIKCILGRVVTGHTITTKTGSTAKLARVKYSEGDNTVCTAILIETKGNIKDNDEFTTNTFIATEYPFPDVVPDKPKEFIAPICSGKITSGLDAKYTGEWNGIHMDYLNGDHTVIGADDYDSFVIRVNANAVKSGRYGVDGATAILNHKWDMVNISGSIQTYDFKEKITFRGIRHGTPNGIYQLTNYMNTQEDEVIRRNENTVPKYPMKITSSINSNLFASNAPFMRITMELENPKTNSFVAPQINIDSLSATFVSNRITSRKADDVQDVNKAEAYYPETDPKKGSELYKYVSKTIQLANPAKDLKVWFEVNLPNECEVQVYIRTSADVSKIDEQDWIQIGGTDMTDNWRRDMTGDIYQEIEIFTNRVLLDDKALKDFSAFQVKLVGKSNVTNRFPAFRALRCIALT